MKTGSVWKICLLMAGLVAFSFLLGNWRVPTDSDLSLPPSSTHWLGTSPHGHDILFLCIAATSRLFFLSAVTAILAIFLGVLLGIFSFYANVRFLALYRIFCEIITTLGVFLFAVCLLSVIPGIPLGGLVLVCMLMIAPGISLIVKDELDRIDKLTYVIAARSIGIGPWRMLSRYIFPEAQDLLLAEILTIFSNSCALYGALAFVGASTISSNNLGYLIYDSLGYLNQNPFYCASMAFAFIILFFVAHTLSRYFLKTAKLNKVSLSSSE